jgi:hypothetical protein
MTSNLLTLGMCCFYGQDMGHIGGQNGRKRRVQEVFKVWPGLRPKCGVVLASVGV